MSDVVWIAGKYMGEKPWEIIGVFSSEEKAVAACTLREHFVGPVMVDVCLPEETVSWNGAYYPAERGSATESGGTEE